MRALLVFSITTCFGFPALAGEILVQLAGDSFDGPPAFEIALDDKTVGTGELDPAVPADQPKTFTFQVPDGTLAGAKMFSVRLTNDLYAAGKGDRNLYLFGARVGGRTLKANDFKLLEEGKLASSPSGASIPLLSDTQQAVADAPSDGWLATAGTADCGRELQLTGYAVNEFNLNPAREEQLVQFLSATVSGACALSVTGYASPSGTEAVNKKVSQARAEKVMDFILSSKTSFTSQQVVAGGSTGQFGKNDRDNRRVVVTLSN